MQTYMIVRDKNGCITGKVPTSVSVILYKNELIKFVSEVYYCVKFNKSFRTLKEFQTDFLIKQRNERKQRKINQHKKAQLKW